MPASQRSRSVDFAPLVLVDLWVRQDQEAVAPHRFNHGVGHLAGSMIDPLDVSSDPPAASADHGRPYPLWADAMHLNAASAVVDTEPLGDGHRCVLVTVYGADCISISKPAAEAVMTMTPIPRACMPGMTARAA